MLLTATFSPEQYERGLESWEWIGIQGKEPLLSSLFGDLFLKDDAGIWFLDASVEGTLELVCSDLDELQAGLDTAEGQDRYLLGGLAMAAETRGIARDSSSIYNFTVPPILGGAIDAANISSISFVVGLNLAGQLHRQVQDLPPGTSITGVTVEQPPDE